METVTRPIARIVSVALAGLVAVTLLLAFLATAEAAPRGGGGHGGGGGGHNSGGHGGGHRGGHHGGHHGHWHGGRGCCWGGLYASPFFYPYYPYYPYYYGYPAYAYPPPVYTYTSPPTYVQPVTSTPQVGGYTSLDTTPIQREVVYPHGKYVLYGDGVTQAWQWVWVPNPPPAPPQN